MEVLYLLSHIGTIEKGVAGRQDLNPQPSVLETDALPIELLPCNRQRPKRIVA